MKNQLVLLCFFTLLIFTNIKAQDISSLLYLNADPHSLALGSGGVANVNSDPGDYYFNPALLGYFSQHTNFSYQTYSTIPELSGNKLNTNCFTLGYKYSVDKDLNISAGFGYRRFNIGYNSFYANGNNKYDSYSFGLSMEYFINLSFGMNFKKAVTGYDNFYEPPYPGITASAKDWGLLLTVPVLKLINPNLIYKPGTMELVPFINFSLGYSKSNIGDEYETYPGRKYQLPLTARLGYNLSFGADIKIDDNILQLLNISFLIEARDLMLEYQESTPYVTKQSGLGHINIPETLFKWKSTDQNEISKGKSITLLETVSYLKGALHYLGGRYITTDGYEVSSAGLFKFLSMAAYNDNAYIKYILDHLEFKYVKASLNPLGNYYYTNSFSLSTLSVSVKNISF